MGNDAQQSLALGKIVTIKPPKTIADGAIPVSISPLTFSIIKKNVSNIFTVTDEQLKDELKFYAQTMKLIVEPTACLSIAGVRNCGLDLKGKRIGVIVTGGNVSIDRYAQLIS